MRLTLRTLLAYLDDTLEPDDAASLRVKIEESTFATSLVARIRAAIQEQSLGAAPPDAVGPLENANVISEYLDSTLSGEQVAEIERHCLEHDTSLAEAAACHQILTVVLGQPARVSEGLRQRIYALPDSEALRQAEAASTQADSNRQPDASKVDAASGAAASGAAAGAASRRFASIDIPPVDADDAAGGSAPGSDGAGRSVQPTVAGAHPIAEAASSPANRPAQSPAEPAADPAADPAAAT